MTKMISNAPDLSGVTCWTSIESREEYYLSWGNRNGTILLAQFNGPIGQVIVTRRYNDDRLVGYTPYKMKHFVSERYLWLVIAYEPRLPTEQFAFAVYQVNGTVFKRRQLIKSNEYVDFDIMRHKRSFYMAVSLGPPLGQPEPSTSQVSQTQFIHQFRF